MVIPELIGEWKSSDSKTLITFFSENRYDCIQDGKSYIGIYEIIEADGNTAELKFSKGPDNLRVWMNIEDNALILENRTKLKKII